jgi:hypothetical protein
MYFVFHEVDQLLCIIHAFEELNFIFGVCVTSYYIR